MGSSKLKMTEHNLSFRMKSSSRLAGGASRSAGNSFRADRSAPGCRTCTRSTSPDFEEERFGASVGTVLAAGAEEEILLPPLLERPDFEDGVVELLLEEDESSFWRIRVDESEAKITIA